MSPGLNAACCVTSSPSSWHPQRSEGAESHKIPAPACSTSSERSPWAEEDKYKGDFFIKYLDFKYWQNSREHCSLHRNTWRKLSWMILACRYPYACHRSLRIWATHFVFSPTRRYNGSLFAYKLQLDGLKLFSAMTVFLFIFSYIYIFIIIVICKIAFFKEYQKYNGCLQRVKFLVCVAQCVFYFPFLGIYMLTFRNL